MKRNYLILLIIILLAFSLRINDISKIPPSLNWDEAAIGYNAYSILKTGRDEWNEFLPLHFKSFGEYKLPVQIYASIPGIAIFGLNEFGVRITPVIYGTLTILFLFFLTRAILGNVIIGIIAAFLLAISPWHIQLTRASFESSFSLFWVILAIWLLVKGFKDFKWILISMIPFAVSVYTYNSARVFTPLFLFVVLLIYRKFFFKYKKILLLSFFIFSLLMLPLLPFALDHGSARYRLVSITDEEGLLPRINENRGNSNLPDPLPRIIHNKATYITFYFISNYIAHFNPEFLFLSGASHKQHHVQGIGELYLFQAPFVLFGLYVLIRRKNIFKGLLISWILISFIPVSVTNDSIPNALRTVIANPFYQLVTALGLYEVFIIVKKRNLFLSFFLITVTLFFGVYQFITYLNNYYLIYPKLYSRDWQYGYKQVMGNINSKIDNYDKIFITNKYGQPYIFTLFYLKYPPENFQKNPALIRVETKDFIDVSRFGKFYFVDFKDKNYIYEEIKNNNPGLKVLFVGTPSDFPENAQKIYSVDFLNGDGAFKISE